MLLSLQVVTPREDRRGDIRPEVDARSASPRCRTRPSSSNKTTIIFLPSNCTLCSVQYCCNKLMLVCDVILPYRRRLERIVRCWILLRKRVQVRLAWEWGSCRGRAPCTDQTPDTLRSWFHLRCCLRSHKRNYCLELLKNITLQVATGSCSWRREYTTDIPVITTVANFEPKWPSPASLHGFGNLHWKSAAIMHSSALRKWESCQETKTIH